MTTQTTTTQRHRDAAQRDAVSDAAAWEAGALAEFEDLLGLVRAAPAGVEALVMPRLAVVGAALLQSLTERRRACAASAPRRGRGRRRSSPATTRST
ncbi:MAG: hypothetical protein M9894_05845 [Planctomycetes bacterium]|nr:hypothetical protein [Planctomycetota bacterium]